MIIIYHWSDGVPDASWSVKDAMIGEDTHYQACYFTGLEKPNYPMPAIPLAVKYDYIGCVNIDDVSDPEDPIIVWMYDSWHKVNC